jgi:transposase
MIDAKIICLFTEKNHLELPIWKASSEAVKKIKIFHRERAYRVKMRTNLMQQQHDYSLMNPIKLDKELMKLNQNLIKGIEKKIHFIECEIQAIINEEIILKEQAQRIQTIPGVGKVLSWIIIAKTEEFTAFTDPRKMACYAGVVPFDN